MGTWLLLNSRVVALIRFAAIERGGINDKVTRIESSCELLQCKLFPRAVRTLEQDDGASAVRDLRQLQLREMLSKRGKRGIKGRIHAPRLTH